MLPALITLLAMLPFQQTDAPRFEWIPLKTATVEIAKGGSTEFFWRWTQAAAARNGVYRLKMEVESDQAVSFSLVGRAINPRTHRLFETSQNWSCFAGSVLSDSETCDVMAPAGFEAAIVAAPVNGAATIAGMISRSRKLLEQQASAAHVKYTISSYTCVANCANTLTSKVPNSD